MSAQAVITKLLPAAAPMEPIWKFTVPQYHQMISGGILAADDPVELLDGWLVQKMPQDGDHVFVTQWLRDYLSELLDRHWCVNTQAPVTLSNSEPEPDCAVLRGNRAHFRGRKPLGKEVALVIEVADTLRRDRWKKGIYARAGISMYWIVNLEQSCVEVYSQPVKSKQDYKSTRIFQADEPVPLILDGKELASVPFKSVLP